MSAPFPGEHAVTYAGGEYEAGEYEAGEYEDGNALAGPLSEIFAVDITTAEGRCTGCGATGPIARLRVYGPAPGLVARCPDCGQVVLRLVRSDDAAWLDLRGTVNLRIRLGE